MRAARGHPIPFDLHLIALALIDHLSEGLETGPNLLGAANIKDMGRTMAALKQSYAGRMDFSKASTIVKQRLGGV